VALSARLADRLRASLREEDLGKAATAIALALLTVVASLVAALQAQASIEAGQRGRAAEATAARASGDDVGQVIQVGTAYGLYRRWFEELEDAAWASAERVKATAQEQQAALDAIKAANDEIAAWIRTQSPLLQPPYWSDAIANTDFGAFEADRLTGPSVAQGEHAAAEQAVADGWAAKASEYVTVLTLVAVGLFFVGLAGTLTGLSRRFLGTAGVAFGVVALVWTGLIAVRPIHRTPDAAIDKVVESQIALARAPKGAGTNGLTEAGVAAYQKAIDAAAAAVALDPDYDQARVAFAGASVGLANELIIAGGTTGPEPSGVLDAAVAAYEHHLRIHDDDANGWWNLGWARYLLGDQPASVEATDRALSLRPTEFTLYLNRSLARAAMGDDAGAVADVDRALELAAVDTTDSASWYLGQSDYDIGRLAEIHPDDAGFLTATQLRLREARVALRVSGRAVPDASAPDLESTTVTAIDIPRYGGGRIEEGDAVSSGGHVDTTAAVGVRVTTKGSLEGRTVSARLWINDLPRPEYTADVDATGGTVSLDLMSPYGRAGFDLDPGRYTLELYVDGSRRFQLGWVVDPRADAPQFITGASDLVTSFEGDGFDCPDGSSGADGGTIRSCFGYVGGVLRYQADLTSDARDRLTYVVLTAKSTDPDEPVEETARQFFGYAARALFPEALAKRAAAWIDDQGRAINDIELGGTTLRVYGATDDTRQLDIWAPWPPEAVP
jgi:tetratricopeptide (TPR) repeat protein